LSELIQLIETIPRMIWIAMCFSIVLLSILYAVSSALDIKLKSLQLKHGRFMTDNQDREGQILPDFLSVKLKLKERIKHEVFNDSDLGHLSGDEKEHVIIVCQRATFDILEEYYI